MNDPAPRDLGNGSGPRPIPPLFQDDPESLVQVKSFEAEIVDLHAQRRKCEQEAKALARQEMTGDGYFAAQIHSLKQQKMVLATETQHLMVRINALVLGLQPCRK
ncbi:MAG: hypothetical protein V1806_13525 [Pseudomonadota bacterium]